ncbi:MAG: ABC transporter substrate-binding protein [Clostridia bacterium]|nr:ABC transporter substrate-binding protein [Clostridia bacterium]
MKHYVKLLLAAVLCLAMAFTAIGCATAPADTDKGNDTDPPKKAALTVAGIQGPTGVGLANLMETAADSNAIDYTFSIASSPDEVVGKFSSGEVQIASVPTNLAAKLYKKLGGDVQMLAINTAGVLYMVENGNSIQSVADLRGKTIYSTGEGANPEYVLRHVLKENGLDPDKDVTIEFLAENTELITKLATGAAEVAMVPEPALTTVMTKKDTLRVALSIDEEWNKIEPDSGMLMGCVIAKKSFVEANKDTVKAFLTEYKASIEAAKDVDKTAALCAKHGIIAAEAVAKNAIPRCNILYLDGADMKARIGGYYQILFNADPTSIGGAVPDDAFYFQG